jgi:large subunit ribosomal protein L23
VSKDAKKPEVKAAIEMMFDVKVDAVTISNVKGKTKRSGAKLGRRPSWKKAFVKLSEGQEIQFLDAE